MIFKVHCDKGSRQGLVNGTWRWVCEASEDEPLCQSFGFTSEKECRSHIAKIKVAMKGARFAKVVNA